MNMVFRGVQLAVEGAKLVKGGSDFTAIAGSCVGWESKSDVFG